MIDHDTLALAQLAGALRGDWIDDRIELANSLLPVVQRIALQRAAYEVHRALLATADEATRLGRRGPYAVADWLLDQASVHFGALLERSRHPQRPQDALGRTLRVTGRPQEGSEAVHGHLVAITGHPNATHPQPPDTEPA